MSDIYVGGEGDTSDDVELVASYEYYENTCQCANPGGGIEIIDGQKTTVNIYINWTQCLRGVPLTAKNWLYAKKSFTVPLSKVLDIDRKHKCHKPDDPDGSQAGNELTAGGLADTVNCSFKTEKIGNFPFPISNATINVGSFAVSAGGNVNVLYVKKGADEGTSCGNTDTAPGVVVGSERIPGVQDVASVSLSNSRNVKEGPPVQVSVCKMKPTSASRRHFRAVGKGETVTAPSSVTVECISYVECPDSVDKKGGCISVGLEDMNQPVDPDTGGRPLGKRPKKRPGTIGDAIDNGWDFGENALFEAKSIASNRIKLYVFDFLQEYNKAIQEAGEKGCGIISVDANLSISVG